MGSLKSRLLITVVFFTLLVYVASAFGLYEYLEYKEKQNLINALSQQLELVTGLIEEEDNGQRIELELDQLTTGKFVDLYSGRYYVVDVEGQPSILSLSLGGNVPRFARLSGKEKQFEATGPQQENLLVMSQQLRFANRDIRITVAESKQEMKRWLHDIRRALLLGLPILLMVLGGGLSLLIRYALKPLDQLITEIENFDFYKQTEIDPPDVRPVSELRKLSTAFNQLLKRFQKIREAEEQLLINVSHQLKTPLTVILSTCDITLQRQREAKHYRQSLEQVQDTGRSMRTLIVRLLSAAHLSSENRRMEKFSQCALEEITEDAVSRMQLLAQQKDIALNYFCLNPVSIQGNSERLEELVLILIENAVHYSPNQTEISVSTGIDHEKAILTVEDQGIGILPDDLPFVFQRFFRGQNTESISGTGLGLTLAEQIVQLHKGQITVENCAQGGSKFTCYFPRETRNSGISSGNIKNES